MVDIPKNFISKHHVGKSGIFFTLISILLASLLVISLMSYSDYSRTNTARVIETRINTMNSFISNLDKDMRRGVYTSGFRSLLAIVSYSVENGTYINNLSSSFREVFLNGTLNNTEFSLVENSSFGLWMSRMETQARALNIYVNFSVSNVSIMQTNAWHVDVIVNASVFVKDINNLANWSFNENIKEQIPIIGFEDPVYSIETGKKVVNTIERSNLTNFIGEDNSTGNLSLLVNTSEYTLWTNAPNYLMRIQGNLSASKDNTGIESLVNLERLENLGVTVYNKSVVDYVYFSNLNPKKHRIKNMPDWFKLDALNNTNKSKNHLTKYQVENLTID